MKLALLSPKLMTIPLTNYVFQPGANVKAENQNGDNQTKHPVSVLNEKCRGDYTFDLSWEKMPNGTTVHTAKLTINGKVYECKGKNSEYTFWAYLLDASSTP